MSGNMPEYVPAPTIRGGRPESDPRYRFVIIVLAIVTIALLALADTSDSAIYAIASIVGINCGLGVARKARRQ